MTKQTLNEQGVPTGILTLQNPSLLEEMKALAVKKGAAVYYWSGQKWLKTNFCEWYNSDSYKVEYCEPASALIETPIECANGWPMTKIETITHYLPMQIGSRVDNLGGLGSPYIFCGYKQKNSPMLSSSLYMHLADVNKTPSLAEVAVWRKV